MVVRVHNAQPTHQVDIFKVICFIVLLWVVVMAVNVPTLLAHTIKQYGDYTYCGIENYALAPVFFTFFAFGYALPLLVIGALYARIVHFLRSRKPSSIDQQRARERTSRACRVVSLVVVVFGVVSRVVFSLVVVVFGIAWLPHHVNAIVSYYYPLPDGRLYMVLRILWYCMSYGNSCVNPFIYSYASEEFRNGFRRAVNCCCCAARVPSSSDTAITAPSSVMKLHSVRRMRRVPVVNAGGGLQQQQQ